MKPIFLVLKCLDKSNEKSFAYFSIVFFSGESNITSGKLTSYKVYEKKNTFLKHMQHESLANSRKPIIYNAFRFAYKLYFSSYVISVKKIYVKSHIT